MDYVFNGVRRLDTYKRFRHKIIETMMRIRGKTEAELISFFTKLEFIKVDTPALTKLDCEGAGEMFTVTTLPLDSIPKTKDGVHSFYPLYYI